MQHHKFTRVNQSFSECYSLNGNMMKRRNASHVVNIFINKIRHVALHKYDIHLL